MTIGVFGYPEHVISEPMGPKDIVKIVYDKCMQYDPIEAVLQQEVGMCSQGKAWPLLLPLEWCSQFSPVLYMY